jgi:hypothetical protein
VQVKLSGLELRRPRVFGNCWLACELWPQLGLDEFWQQRLPEAREAVGWEKVLRLRVVNRLLDPAVSSTCIGSGSWTAPWTSHWKRTSPWPKKIGCIGVWTGS